MSAARRLMQAIGREHYHFLKGVKVGGRACLAGAAAAVFSECMNAMMIAPQSRAVWNFNLVRSCNPAKFRISATTRRSNPAIRKPPAAPTSDARTQREDAPLHSETGGQTFASCESSHFLGGSFNRAIGGRVNEEAQETSGAPEPVRPPEAIAILVRQDEARTDRAFGFNSSRCKRRAHVQKAFLRGADRLVQRPPTAARTPTG